MRRADRPLAHRIDHLGGIIARPPEKNRRVLAAAPQAMVQSLSNQSATTTKMINVASTSIRVATSTVTAANVVITDLSVAKGVEFAASSLGVRFTNAAHDGAMVEKRVSENARWGLGVRASDGTTHVHAGSTGRVVLGHALTAVDVAAGLVVMRDGTPGSTAANVGINTSSPAAALHVVGNVHVDGLVRAAGALRMYPDHRRQPSNYMTFDVRGTDYGTDDTQVGRTYVYGNLYQYSEVLGRVERITFTGYPRVSGLNNPAGVDLDVNTVFEFPSYANRYWNIQEYVKYDDTTVPLLWRANVEAVAADVNLRTQVRTISTPASTTFNAASVIGGASLTMQFEYPLFLRYVYMNERAGYASRTVGQVYAVGTSVAIDQVTAGTEWNEIDVLSFVAPESASFGRMRRDPQPVVKTLGLANAYRTIRLIVYARMSSSGDFAQGINAGRVRVFGVPGVLHP